MVVLQFQQKWNLITTTLHQTDGMDDRSVSFGTDALGTVTFHGHGGSSVMGQWDDMTPNAYEEVWDTTTGADIRIDGRSGNNLLTYDSPSFNGVMFKMAHQHDHQQLLAKIKT